MQSKATSVRAYIEGLPEDRRAAIEAVRKTILDNLDAEYEEGMQYGMIGYYVPHRVFPAGYHCDPKQPLPFAGLASQKGHMSMYLMCTYMSPELDRWFREAWTKSGRKLDMGKGCVRFKKLQDVPLDVVGEVIRRVPARAFIKHYEAGLASREKQTAAGKAKPSARSGNAKAPKASKASAGPTLKKTAKKAAKKTSKTIAKKVAKKTVKKVAARSAQR